MAGPARLVTPTFVVAWVVNFLQYLTFYMLVTTMALYAVKSFAASDAVGGFASSAFVVGATVARLVSGYLVDVLGRRKMLLIALVVVAIACTLYLPAGPLPVLIGVRLLHGFGYAFASTAVMTIAQSVIPDPRRGEGTGYFALGTTLATAVGPALGLFLVGTLDYTWLFWTTLVTAVLGMVLGILAAANQDWQVVVAGVMTGLGYGTLMPAAQAIALNAVPALKLGTGISTLLLVDVGVGVGPVVLGLLFSAAGFGTMYTVLAVLVVVAAVLYHAVHGWHPHAKRGRLAVD